MIKSTTYFGLILLFLGIEITLTPSCYADSTSSTAIVFSNQTKSGDYAGSIDSSVMSNSKSDSNADNKQSTRVDPSQQSSDGSASSSISTNEQHSVTSSTQSESASNSQEYSQSSNLEPDTGMIYTPVKDADNDPLKGGTLAINNKFTVSGNDVAYYSVFYYHVSFRITWSVPEGVAPQQCLNALNINQTRIYLGNNEIKLDKNSFKINKDGDIEFVAADRSFDLLSMIKYLWNLIFGGGTAEVFSYLHFDVNKLSDRFPKDASKNYVVTKNKLVPNINNKLNSTLTFYSHKNVQVQEKKLELMTWNSYVSPWNQKETDSDNNGKPDDTQTDGSTEVQGVNRVLKGDDYKNRIVEKTIEEKINPSEYIRVVNLFTKTVVNNVPITIDAPIVDNSTSDKGDTAFLTRTTMYCFRGNNLISPVSMKFQQKSHLKFVASGSGTYAETDKIPIKGSVDTEGNEVNYFYSVDHGKERSLSNKGVTHKKLEAVITGLTLGKHLITIKAVNAFGLYKTVDIYVNIYSGSLAFKDVPCKINFGESKISSSDIRLKGQKRGDLIISDTRPTNRKSDWTLFLKQPQPLVDKLARLTYKSRDNKDTVINDNGQPIEHNLANKPNEENISENWSAQGHGLTLSIPSESQKIGDYSGKLVWTLQTTPKAN